MSALEANTNPLTAPCVLALYPVKVSLVFKQHMSYFLVALATMSVVIRCPFGLGLGSVERRGAGWCGLSASVGHDVRVMSGVSV